MTIWKYVLTTCEEQTIAMPRGAEILALQIQGGLPCIWAEVNPERPLEDKYFITCGTGFALKARANKYVGTYQLTGDGTVFHVFEEA